MPDNWKTSGPTLSGASCFSTLNTLLIPSADPAWKLLMQSGAIIHCTVGISMDRLLREEFGLSDEQLAPVDALLLDGMPVDEPESTVVPNQARLALASGLPGIAGLAMRKGSPVRGLRSGITHTGREAACPRPGQVSPSLYSLTLPQLAGHFLARGVIVDSAQLLRYARFAPTDECLLNGRPIRADELAKRLGILPEQNASPNSWSDQPDAAHNPPAGSLVLLIAHVMS